MSRYHHAHHSCLGGSPRFICQTLDDLACLQHPPGWATGGRPLQEPLFLSQRESYLPSSIKVGGRRIHFTCARRDRTYPSVPVHLQSLMKGVHQGDTMYMTLPAQQVRAGWL